MINAIMNALRFLGTCFRRQLDDEIERVIENHEAIHQDRLEPAPSFIITSSEGSSVFFNNSPISNQYGYEHPSGHPRLARRNGMSDLTDMETIKSAIRPSLGL